MKEVIFKALKVIVLSLLLASCEEIEEGKDKLEEIKVDLEKLADQIIVTFPANDSLVEDSVVIVRADVPDEAKVKELILYVDGIEVAKDSDGSPWEIAWPTYYWGDDSTHSLLLKAITESDVEVRNNQQYQVRVSSEVNNFLAVKSPVFPLVLKDTNEVNLTFQEVQIATAYEIVYSGGGKELILESDSPKVLLTELLVSPYQLKYRAKTKVSEETTLTGPWSESFEFTVDKPDSPEGLSSNLVDAEGTLNVELSWQDFGDGNSYIVNMFNNSKNQEYSQQTTDTSTLTFENLDVGEYSWSVKRINQYGHVSEESTSEFKVIKPDSPSGLTSRFVDSESALNVELSWLDFGDGNSYKVNLFNNSKNQEFSQQITNTNSSTFEGLDVGRYTWRVKRINEYGHVSEESVSEFEVTKPNSPIPNVPIVNYEQGKSHYSVEFSWDEQSSADTYTLEITDINDVSNKRVFSDILGSSHILDDIAPGEYIWSISRTNKYGHISDNSLSQELTVGLFNLKLGGDNHEGIIKFKQTKDGGYLILAYTHSRDLDPKIDINADDWIMKLSSNGDLEWEFFSHASGRERLTDIIELSDGSFIAVGRDWSSDSALAIKLSSAGEKQWEVLYKPDSIVERYDFERVVEFDGKVFVSAKEWGVGGCNGCITVVNNLIHTIDREGVISEQKELPKPDEFEIDSIDGLTESSDGLVLTGSAEPHGAYLLILDDEFEVGFSWHNAGGYDHRNVITSKKLSDGKYLLLGQSNSGWALSKVDTNTESNTLTAGGSQHISSSALIGSDNNNIYLLMREQHGFNYPYPMAIVGLDENLIEKSHKVLTNYQNYTTPYGIVRHNDGTFIVIFTQKRTGSYHDDIIISKMKMDFE